MSDAAPVVVRHRDASQLALEVEVASEALDPARLAVIDFLAPHRLSDKAIYIVELVLEEVLVNVVWYAFADGEPRPPMGVEVVLRNGDLVLTVDDAGRAFDPLQAPEAARPSTLDEAVPGGLGVALVKRYCTALHYERRDGHNRLSATIERA